MYGSREKLSNGSFGRYLWKSYNEVYAIVTNLAKCFEELNFCPTIKEDGRIVRPLGILCKTREEWVFTWFSTWYLGGCIVPLYDSLSQENIEWIINQCELTTVVTTTPLLSKLIQLKTENKVKTLKNLITIEDPTADEIELCKKHELQLYKFSECIEIGKKSNIKLNPKVGKDTLATICYTSGTTGNPKGVMLTHKNYVSMIIGVAAQKQVNLQHGECCLSWLPLAHVLEQFVITICVLTGIKIGFYSGDITKLTDDLQELRPQYFGSVPRVFNKIYEKTNKEIAKLSGFKRWFYNKGVAAKLDYLHKTGFNNNAFYDNILFSKIRKLLGGNIIVIFLGGAPISPDVLEMSRIWLCCFIFQGYGQTETTGPIMVNRFNDLYPCSIGSTLIHAEGKLVDIPEMDYFSTDTTDGKPTPRGEIMLRSGAVSPGYWREPKLTRETFTEDGWVHTGDVGKLSPWGNMMIIDRKKNLFKLAQVISFLISRVNTSLQIV